MEEEGVEPDIITFTCALKACSSARMIDKGQNIHARITELGYNDLILMSNMVDFYAKNGFMLEAQEVFEKLTVRDTVAWMALIAGYAEHGPHEEVFRCLWQMQEERLSPDAAILVCVLKASGNVGSFSQGQLLHIDLVNKGLETDIFVANTLVDVYSKCGSVSDARAVFDERSKKDVVSWNALLLGYAEYGPLHEAISCFEQLAAFLSPNSTTLCTLLKAVGGLGISSEGYNIHTLMTEKGLEHELYNMNTLIDMYAKCGSLMEAQKVFDMLEERSIVSWTVLVSGYAEQGLISKALHCFEQMQSSFITPDAAVLVCALKACSNVGEADKGKEIHRTVTEMGFERDLMVENSLVDMYAKCGLVKEAQHAFDKLHSKNIASWTTLISLYTDSGLIQEGLDIFEQALSANVAPDVALFACALNACDGNLSLCKGREIHASVIKTGLEDDIIIGSSTVNMYAGCSSISEAHAIFDRMRIQDITSWNALMMGYAEHGCNEEVARCFEQMEMKGINCDVVTYVPILKSCGSLGAVDRGFHIHREVTKKGFDKDSFIGNALVHMYAKCGTLLDARLVFESLPVKDVISWNTLIAGYTEYGPAPEALLCFEHMQKANVQPTVVSFTCCLKACGITGAIGKGRRIHNVILQKGWEFDISIGNTLVDMYGKCSSVQEAHQVFDHLSTPGVAAWNAMIKGYGLNHDSKKALSFFSGMLEQGVKPNSITFLCLLVTCSHNNLVAKGQEYFMMMIEQFGIMPSSDHFCCMVDLFSRSGSLIEAEKFLEALPCSPSKDIWMPLLSACRMNAEIDIGYKCFEQLVNMDPDCASSYVLMSNLHASFEDLRERSQTEEL
ncbi:hypothetical protein KP509_28G026700 [Ceratopteris richardii]|nr:hypothetical protein KP509_28G026700 [Ceratopteris richardii]